MATAHNLGASTGAARVAYKGVDPHNRGVAPYPGYWHATYKDYSERLKEMALHVASFAAKKTDE